MKKIICQKLIAVSLLLIMGLSSVMGFAQTSPDPRSAGSLVKGFDKSIFDYHFSRADREMSPDRWISEARRGAALALNAWELFASDLYDSPLLLESAKRQVEEWSADELEERFTRWLTGRFFGASAEKAITDIVTSLDENHRRYTWHYDSEGNLVYDDKTSAPLVVRPGERDFSLDLPMWRNEAEQKINAASSSFEDTITRMYPELLACIPVEMRDSLGDRIAFAAASFSQTLQKEFEGIAAREERIFTSRRTGDVWSLRKKNDDEAAFSITAQLIEEVESTCSKGIAALTSRIEEASAGSGDLALMGAEWLDMYREQFDRGLKAWEQAEERFFIRRIEWEQEAVRLFNTGEETWIAAFNQFENERKNWELKTKALFESGESLFKTASANLERAIAGAKIEFERDFQIRTEAGTVRAQALVDMYFTACKGAAAARENIQFLLKQYSSGNKPDPDEPSFAGWLDRETRRNSSSGALIEIKKSFQLYTAYLEKAKESRQKIITDYNGLIGGGRLKDVLSDNNSSEDFTLDEYQTALIKAKTAIQYWERQTAIAEAVSRYAQDLSAGRMTEAESVRAWETAKAAYNESLVRYEKDLETLSAAGASLQEKQAALSILAAEMGEAENVLNSLNLEYSTLIAVNAVNRENYMLVEFNLKYAELLDKYRYLNRTGSDSAYKDLLEYALEMGVAQQKETTEFVTWLLINGDGENMQSLAELQDAAVPGSEAEIDLMIRICGIDLFSAETGAAWYCGIWGIDPSEDEEASLTGKKLKERLIADVEKSLEEENPAGYRFFTGLLELYENFGGAAPFVIKEAWQDTINDIGLLYAGYGISSQSSLLPDVEDICSVLLGRPGDFAHNAAEFLYKFDSCFRLIPEWLESEISNWKESFCEYFTLNAMCNGKSPGKNMAALIAEQEAVENRYRALEDYYASSYPDDAQAFQKIKELYAEIKKDEILLSYRSLVTGIWEQNIKQVSDAETEKIKHWRQYLIEEYISGAEQQSNESSVRTAYSWKEGMMLDALDNAVFNNRRINTAFSLYDSHNWKMESREKDVLSNLYDEETVKIKSQQNNIVFLREDLARLGRGYEYSRMAPDVLKKELDRQYSALKSQEAAYNALRSRYLRDAESFAAAGNRYDEQYTRVKNAFENTETKRFEYETQDAIRRWASTAYLDHESGELENCKDHLMKAQTVLDVLSNLYNNEEVRPYENPAYMAIYSKYQQSFKNALVSLKVYNVLNTAIMEETINNNNIFNAYQKYLYTIGNAHQYSADYISSSDRSEWTIKDIVTLKNGMLAFSKNGAMKLDGIDTDEASALCDYFTANQTFESGRHEVSQFDTALLGLTQRMKSYFSDSDKFPNWVGALMSFFNVPDKYSKWGLARDYLIRTLIESNPDIRFLQNEYAHAAPLTNGGSMVNAPYKSGLFDRIEYIGGYISNKQYLFHNDQQWAWNKLSAQERADLEFYVILSLFGNNNSYSYGFSQYTARNEFQTAYNMARRHYRSARFKVKYLPLAGLLWIEMRDINGATSSRLAPSLNQTEKYTEEWENGLEGNINNVIASSSAYIRSCNKLNKLEGVVAPGQTLKWDDIYLVLTATGGINDEEIDVIRNCWEAKFADGGGAYPSIIDGLRDMVLWTVDERDNNKNDLNNQWHLDNQTRQKTENDFLLTMESYMAGETGVEALTAAALSAYGRDTAAWKKHYTNIERTLIQDLEMFPSYGSDYLGNFSELGNEYISLVINTLNNRYYAELAIREAEWKEQRRDLTDKYNEWRETADLLNEKGREDWKNGAKKLEANYKQWNADFQEEQRRISGAWAKAYLAGLEDKEEWLERAASAADNASSDALLRTVGAEAERLARFLDTREPLGIRNAIPETEIMLAELLNKPGIGNIENIFGVMGNMSSPGAAAVRRGMGGSIVWDANIVKAAASDMARETNAEIANKEARRLAYNAHATAMEALKSLSINVDAANRSFREGMDKMYIVQGQWTKSGTAYIKDIIVGSTFFEPVITERKKVDGYNDYRLGPVALKTNMDEERLAGLNSFAVRGLIENVNLEIEMLMAEIFGDGSKQEIKTGEGNNVPIRYLASGKFGAHIGYEPAMRPSSGSTSRDSMFYDRGSGELGRLITDFYYWSSIDGQGLAKLSIPIWDKPIWDDRGSFFTAPSLRSAAGFVGQIAGFVAAPFTAGAGALVSALLTAAINTVDDLVFNALDAGYGYKTIDEAGFAFGKSLLANSIGSFVSAGFNGVEGIKEGFFASGNGLTGAVTAAVGSDPSFTKAVTQTIMSGVQTFTTGTINSAMNSVIYSHENGWGYSGELFREGMKGTANSMLVSAASVFTTGTLTSINNTEDMKKFKGISHENYNNTATLNSVLGSLAGQGVQYALENDFTLNLLNTSYLKKGNTNGGLGLLELHLGRDGSPRMNFGSGGANVSPDTIVRAIRGADVWNMKNQVAQITDDEALRSVLLGQYGYGDEKQKQQLKDILAGKIEIQFDANAEYTAKTAIIDGKQLLTLGGYDSGMSDKEQARLAAIMGHEAYRDGYHTGTKSDFDELRTASIARLFMGDRISEDYQWFYDFNGDFAQERFLLAANMDLFDDYQRIFFNNDEDHFWQKIEIRDNDYQNQGQYKNIPLFNGAPIEATVETNKKNLNTALIAYKTQLAEQEGYIGDIADFVNNQGKTDEQLRAELENDKALRESFGYKKLEVESIRLVGCMFMSLKYSIETLGNTKINTIWLNDYIKENKLFSNTSDLSVEQMVTIMNNLSDGKFTVTLLPESMPGAKNKVPSVARLWELEQSSAMYIAHVRIRKPGTDEVHSQMLSDIEFSYDAQGNVNGITAINTANPWNGGITITGRTSFTLDEIDRWDTFKVTPTAPPVTKPATAPATIPVATSTQKKIQLVYTPVKELVDANIPFFGKYTP